MRNISSNGKLFLFNVLAENAFIEYETGISNAGNFYLIRNNCDNTEFRDYESELSLTTIQKDNVKIYCEVALKNLLKAYYKRIIEIAQYKNINIIADQMIIEKEQDFFIQYSLRNLCKISGKKILVSELDLKDYNYEITRCKKILFRNVSDNQNLFTNTCYNIIDTIFIQYTVPVAYQGVITLISDIEGNVVNDIYCDDPKYKQEMLHLRIFPLRNSSLITLFTYKGNKRYSRFRSQFLKLSLDSKLALINYILFLYSEDLFLSGYLDIDSLKTSEFQRVIRTNPTDDFDITSPRKLKKNSLENAMKKFSLSNYNMITNLLSRDFSIEELSSRQHF